MKEVPNTTTSAEQKDKKIFKAIIVDTTDLMKSQAIDVGNQKMEIAPESKELAQLNLWKKMGKKEFWSRLGQKTWKYGLKRDYNRNKEIYKASQEILETGNVFIGEGKDKISHDEVMSDIIDQFASNYEEAIHTEAGEKRVALGKNELEEEATHDKEDAKQLIMDWTTGKISRECFKAQEERLFHKLKENQDEEKVKKNVMYTSNLFEVAEQVKLAIQNKEFMANEDFEFEIIYGKSKASVRTEEHFNKTERIMDKMLHTKVGQFANETTAALIFASVSSLAMRSVASLPGKIVPILGTALISSGFAKKREEMEQIKKKAAHFRRTAKGKVEAFDPDTMPVRTEMDTFSYKTESADNILKGIDKNLNILETNPNLTEQELKALSAELASLDALIQLSDRRGIDLVTYSDSTNVVKERLAVDCKKRQIKDALGKAFISGGHKIPNGQDFETYIDSLATAEENRMISEKDTGIDAKDRAFNKMKTEKGWAAAKTAFITGAIFGAVASEGMGVIQGHTGAVGDLIHTIKGGHTLAPGVSVEHLTMIPYIKHLIQGDLPKMNPGKIHEVLLGNNHLKLPEGVNAINNPDGSFNLVGGGGKVFAEHLTTNPDGSLTEGAKSILAHNHIGMDNHLIDGTSPKSVNIEEHIKTHPGVTKHIEGRKWLDSDTPDYADFNEVKTQLSMDAQGNYVVDIGKYTPDGSFKQDLSVNVQELLKTGKVEILFSPNGGNDVFPIVFGPDGKAIIPPGSDLGKLMFANVDGHPKFLGRFGEVAQDMGKGHYQMFSTMEGKGIHDIIDIVKTPGQETLITIPGSYDGDLMFIPIVPGHPLETVTAKKKQEEQKKDINPIGVIPAGEKGKEGDDKNKEMRAIGQGERVKEMKAISQFSVDNENGKLEKQKSVIENEMSQEEYDGMRDDLKMLNRKIQISEGIITLGRDDFKSEYGKKRYMDLKSIPDGIPVRFNKTELQTIGDEMERMLKNAKVISKEEMAKRLDAENKAKSMESDMKSDLEMLNKNIRESKGIITLEESDFKSEFGKEKYRKLKSIPDGIPVRFNKDELAKIGDEMERYLINYQEIINGKKERVIAKENTEETKGHYVIGPDGQAVYTEKNKGSENIIINQSGEIIKNDNENVTPKEKPKIIKKETAPIAETEVPPVVTTENSKPVTETKKEFKPEDLSKMGTEFESEFYTYKTIVASKPFWGLFGKDVTLEVTDKKTKKTTMVIAKEKALIDQLNKKQIKITNILEKK